MEMTDVRTRNASDEAESAAVCERSIEGVARERRGAEITRTRGRAETGLHVRRKRSDQSGVEQLSGTDDAQGIEKSSGGSDEEAGSGRRCGADDRRNNASAHGTGRAD